jgi:hypothetical protein
LGAGLDGGNSQIPVEIYDQNESRDFFVEVKERRAAEYRLKREGLLKGGESLDDLCHPSGERLRPAELTILSTTDVNNDNQFLNPGGANGRKKAKAMLIQDVKRARIQGAKPGVKQRITAESLKAQSLMMNSQKRILRLQEKYNDSFQASLNEAETYFRLKNLHDSEKFLPYKPPPAAFANEVAPSPQTEESTGLPLDDRACAADPAGFIRELLNLN